jgi:hypothetical protein
MFGPQGIAARELIDELASRGIGIQVKGVAVEVSRSQLTDDDRAVIRKLKKPIIACLSPCEPHVDSSKWERQPIEDRPGWEKASCQRCGRFIGCNRIKQTSQRGHGIGISETDRAPPREANGGDGCDGGDLHHRQSARNYGVQTSNTV